MGGIGLEIDRTTVYVKAIYWVITTMTTVGYGDITPSSNIQLVYAIFVMVLGVGTYGYIIANIANLLGNIDTARMDFSRKMAVVDAFLAYRAIPADLEQRIREYYQYIWENRLDHKEDEVINDLPDSLQTEVALFLRKPLLSQVPLFHEAGVVFHQEVARYLNIHIYMPGDLIVRRGDHGDSMFFISKGSVRILSANEQDSLAVLGEGSFFGETSLLREQPRNATVYAMGYCNIYSLDKSRFDQLLEKFPSFKKIIVETSAKRETHSSKQSIPDPQD
jgi:voltage-gated potassium channel